MRSHRDCGLSAINGRTPHPTLEEQCLWTRVGGGQVWP